MKANSSINALLAQTYAVERDVTNALTDAYSIAGEMAVAGIRGGSMSNWNDQTGNLRSSIGYAVCKSGRIVARSAFSSVSAVAASSAEGIAACERLATAYARYDFALIVLAGMEYAVYVEAIDGKVVLAGGQLYLEKNIAKILETEIRKALKKYEK